MTALMLASHLASRLRSRYLLAMGIPALVGVGSSLTASACARDARSPMVDAPLLEGDSGAVAAEPIDAGSVSPKPASSSSAKTLHDPPEPTPPRWAHTTTNLCPDANEAPDPAELPAPFEHCPKQTNGGMFSAKATRAERADNPDACCYVYFHGMVVPGRALRGRDHGAAVVARDEPRRDWLAPIAAIDVSRMGAAERRALANAWRHDASLEHASIASFAALALDLMGLGAPADLVARAHAAALDEARHARLCYALAAAYDGDALGPAALAIPRRDPPAFASLVVDTFVDGCLGETIATLEAEHALAHATEPAVRAALTEIARDEAAHAELSFATLAWLVTRGGAAARAALERALVTIDVGTSPDGHERTPRVGSAHGRLAPSMRHRARVVALSAIVEPCVLALLGTVAARALGQRAPTSAATAARS
jgi:hypothetical protein